MSNQQTADYRPATITIRDFVEQGYAELVEAGKCVVEVFGFHPVMASRSWLPVKTIKLVDASEGLYYVTVNVSSFYMHYDRVLQVRWLPAAAQPEAEPGVAFDSATGEEHYEAVIAELKAENERLAGELAAARDALAACTKVLELGCLPSQKPSLREYEAASDYDAALEIWEAVNRADIAVGHYNESRAAINHDHS